MKQEISNDDMIYEYLDFNLVQSGFLLTFLKPELLH